MKLLFLESKNKGIYLNILGKFKTKLIPSPLPAPFRNFIFKKFGQKKTVSSFDFSKVSSFLFRAGPGLGDNIIHTAMLSQLKKNFPYIKTGVIKNTKNNKGNFWLKNPLIDKVFSDSPVTYFKNRKKWDVFIDFDLFMCDYHILCDAMLAPKYRITTAKGDEDAYYFDLGFKNYDFCVSFAESNAHYRKVLELTPLKKYIDNNSDYGYCIPVEPKTLNKCDNIWKKNKTRILLNPSGNQISLNYNFFSKIVSFFNSCKEGIDLLILNNSGNKTFFNLPSIRVSPKLNTQGYFACAATSDIIITTDTSLVHLAGAYDKYAICLYSERNDNYMFLPLNGLKQKCFVSSDGGIKRKDLDAFNIDEITNCIEQFINNIEQEKAVSRTS
jgi:ADP-heptose:LPS heptosyltransferase